MARKDYNVRVMDVMGNTMRMKVSIDPGTVGAIGTWQVLDRGKIKPVLGGCQIVAGTLMCGADEVKEDGNILFGLQLDHFLGRDKKGNGRLTPKWATGLKPGLRPGQDIYWEMA